MLAASKMTANKILSKAQTDIEAVLGNPVELTCTIIPIEQATDYKTKEFFLKNLISQETGIDWLQIQGKSRRREIAMARHLFCFFGREYLKISLKAIGELLNGRDHTTVLHSLETVKDLLDTNDEAMTTLYYKIKAKLYSNED